VLEQFAALNLGSRHDGGESTATMDEAAKLLREVADTEQNGRLSHLDKFEV